MFERIFGREIDEERTEIENDFTSVLDLVTAEVKDLRSGLGADDRAIVNDYLDSVREIERRIHLLKARDLSSLDLPEIPVAVAGFDERLWLQFDLLALAYQTNTTRRDVHDVRGGEQPIVRARGRARRVPSAVASRREQGADGEARDRAALSQRRVQRSSSRSSRPRPTATAGSILDNSIFLYGTT